MLLLLLFSCVFTRSVEAEFVSESGNKNINMEEVIYTTLFSLFLPRLSGEVVLELVMVLRISRPDSSRHLITTNN